MELRSSDNICSKRKKYISRRWAQRKNLRKLARKKSALISEKKIDADIRRLEAQMDAEDFIVITRKSKGKTGLFVIVTRKKYKVFRYFCTSHI
jgi:hypothetical protein